MVPFEKALEIVLQNTRFTGTVRVPLSDTVNRALAEDIFSDIDMPPFDKSAVDGYACRMEDVSTGSLRVMETIPAGIIPQKTIGRGECSKIMTGAMLPSGADGVIMVEDTEPAGDQMIRFVPGTNAHNICYRAENIKTADRVLEKGTIIRPAHIAALASVGATHPQVARLPRVAVLSTGDELVEPGDKPAPAQIRNSNASQLMAQLTLVPAAATYKGIASDQETALYNSVAKAFDNNDGVLLTGGVSMGEFDLVPEILKNVGVEILFKSVAIQPGRPTLFGVKGDQFVFGLPGNPVSSFVLFEIMVKPFLLKMMGSFSVSPPLILSMGTTYQRKKSPRKTMIPVRIDGDQVFPVDYHGSAHINAYIHANGILAIEPWITELKRGEQVHVRPL